MTAGQDCSVDVAVVGGGAAALAAYRAAVEICPRTLLIQSTPRLPNGSLASKLLIAAADAAHDARAARAFGLKTTVVVDGRAVMNGVRQEFDRLVEAVPFGEDSVGADHKIVGAARFIAPGVLDVAGTLVRARAVVVATGAHPVIPAALADVQERVVVHDDVLTWTDLPDSVAIFGAGVVGLEFGQALGRLGVRVRVFGRGGGLGPLTDPKVCDMAARVLGADVPIELEANVRSVRLAGERVLVESEDPDGHPRVETFDYALVAVGRRPNLSDLDLVRGGVRVEEGGVIIADRGTMRVGSSNVFLAGGVRPEGSVFHEETDEGLIAGTNAACYPNVRPRPRRSRLQIVFTDPQIAVAGESFAGVSERGPGVVTSEVLFEEQGRSRVIHKNRGIARVYADGHSGRLLGAEIVGPRAENLGHLLAWAHQQALTIDQMLEMPFFHPSIEEGIAAALRRSRAELRAPRADAHRAHG
ncbi:MAG: dihydrolipoyl dehydrogenase [Polyangiaceae bacterium]